MLPGLFALIQISLVTISMVSGILMLPHIAISRSVNISCLRKTTRGSEPRCLAHESVFKIDVRYVSIYAGASLGANPTRTLGAMSRTAGMFTGCTVLAVSPK